MSAMSSAKPPEPETGPTGEAPAAPDRVDVLAAEPTDDLSAEDDVEQDLAGPLDLALDGDAAPASVLRGAAVIRSYLRHAPRGPGVYRMISDAGEVLYVGKAKSLKKRVTQYAQGRFHTQRIAHMVHLTRSMEFVTTKTETEALLLEINLIKSLIECRE
jgi:hypothetical protein